MRTLTYVWHDCFVYEDKTNIIVFDFWKDTLSENNDTPIFIKNADKNKHLYVLVSHHHKDHFVKKIFEWEKLFRNVSYIISKDVERSVKYLFNTKSVFKGIKPSPENVIVLSKGETFENDNFKVSAFGSTDIGNSYVIVVNNITLFHAGDLNAWIWKDESTNEEIQKALKDYEDILEEIYKKYKLFDLAMFPVDARMGRDYYEGARIFVSKFDIGHFFPMHFCLWENEKEEFLYKNGAVDFEKYANPERGEYIGLISPYSKFAL